MEQKRRFQQDGNIFQMLFERFPELNIRQVARAMGVNESLMRQYVCGTKNPSYSRVMDLENYLHRLGRELLSVRLPEAEAHREDTLL